MKPTIYIAGPMRGRPDFNRPAFNAAAERLAARGWHPINPVDIEKIYPCVEEDGEVNSLNITDLLAIEREFAKRADAIYLLDGWETSEGARGELRTFLEYGGSDVFLGLDGTPDSRKQEGES